MFSRLFKSPSPCPIAIRVIARRPSIEVSCQNIAGKEIVGVKFGGEVLDATLEFVRPIRDYTPKLTLKPGEKSRWLTWPGSTSPEDDPLTPYMDASKDADLRVAVWVMKVLFSDGTIWSDDERRMSLQFDSKSREKYHLYLEGDETDQTQPHRTDDLSSARRLAEEFVAKSANRRGLICTEGEVAATWWLDNNGWHGSQFDGSEQTRPPAKIKAPKSLEQQLESHESRFIFFRVLTAIGGVGCSIWFIHHVYENHGRLGACAFVIGVIFILGKFGFSPSLAVMASLICFRYKAVDLWLPITSYVLAAILFYADVKREDLRKQLGLKV